MTVGHARIRLRVDGELAARVRVGLVGAAPVAVGPASSALREEMRELAVGLVERHAQRPPARIEHLQPARELYRSLGIDPTKTRPSSEALLRRVLRDKPLPLVSNAVDLGNLLALSFLLPIGLYDAERIDGDVELRRGRAGEAYRGIRKDEVHLEGRPLLADRRGPFGNPTSDSLRTAVDASTSALWLVIFAPRSLAEPTLGAHVATARAAMARHLAPPDRDVATSGSVL